MALEIAPDRRRTALVLLVVLASLVAGVGDVAAHNPGDKQLPHPFYEEDHHSQAKEQAFDKNPNADSAGQGSVPDHANREAACEENPNCDESSGLTD